MLRVQEVDLTGLGLQGSQGRGSSDDNKAGDFTSATQGYIKEGSLGQVGMSHRAKYRMWEERVGLTEA